MDLLEAGNAVMFALTNGIFYTGNTVVNDKSLLVKDGIIVGFSSNSDLPENVRQVDLKRKNVAPGFIDLQVNGGCGAFFDKRIKQKQISDIANKLARHGVTRWMPTFLSFHKNDMPELLAALTTIQKIDGILGFHFEGPWLDKDKAGVHNPKNLRRWENQDFDFIRHLAKNLLVCVTLSSQKISPHEISALSKLKGVRVLLGHTLATYEEAVSFFANGGRGVTHIFNAMLQINSRQPGIITAAMDNPRVKVSVIADLFHVDVSVLRLLKRAFFEDAVYLVSDTMPTFYSDTKEFMIGDNVCTLKDGKLIDEKGRLAGSAITIADAVRNCVQKVGIPLDEALRMANMYPAKAVGIDNNYGYLLGGYRADLVVFDNLLNIDSTYRDGELLYQN
jgi:N-acetylglucosamine-6-phosphate deacetylase